jgi:DNA-binding HxlR family transcriptional regulator
MAGSSPEQARCDSTMNRSWHSSRQVDEGKANSASSQQGRQKRVEARPGSQGAEECSAQFALNLIQGKWKTWILSRLQHGPVRLSELRRMFPEASKKMLTQHLREMEKDGLVVRKDLSGKLRHVEYFLSDSKGFAVLHLISTLTRWSMEYRPLRATRRSRLDNPATRIAISN